MVRGRPASRKKEATSSFTKDPYGGLPAVFSTPPSGKRENPPSRPRLPGVVETDEGVFTSLRWRGGSRRDGDRGRSGRVSLGSELWLGYERRSRSGVQWAGLRRVRAALGGSLSPASARWTAPAPLRVYKGERGGHVGSPRPTDVNVHSWGSGQAPRGGRIPSDWRMRSSPGLRLRTGGPG